MLRCSSCGVQHHPGCWVRNNGCATDAPHSARPEPEAYEPLARRPVEAGVVAPASALRPRPEPPGPSRLVGNGSPRTDEVVIGRTSDIARPAKAPSEPPVPVMPRPRAKAGRYPDLTASANGAALPRIYPGHRFLRFWYVPVAALLALAVATGVVWAGDRLLGGDGEDDQVVAPVDTPVATKTTPTPIAAPTEPSAGATTATANPMPTAGSGSPGELGPGAAVIVAGTGDCLNVRTGSGLANDVITCVPDGTAMTVLGGPTEADGLTWWQVEAPTGTGWAAQDYLALP